MFPTLRWVFYFALLDICLTCSVLNRRLCYLRGYCNSAGECVIVDGCPRCSCYPGYTGHRCQETVQPTSSVETSRTSPGNGGNTTSSEQPTRSSPINSVDDRLTVDQPNATCYGVEVCSANALCDEFGRVVCSRGTGPPQLGCCYSCTRDCRRGLCTPYLNGTEVMGVCLCGDDDDGHDGTCVSKCSLTPEHPDCAIATIVQRVKAHETTYIAVGVSVGVTVIMFILMLLVLLHFYKKKELWALKFMYKLQRYEDDESLKYDVFVSYKSHDVTDQFMFDQLFPTLEQRWGFKVCIHEREFKPGNTIANNIEEFLNESRRVVLVLTNAFVTSEWCQHEVQLAQYLMIKKKCRIIPIMFEDIRQHPDLNDSLRYILDHVTYLELPVDHQFDKFWDRLRCSMPKLRSAEKRSNSNKVDCNQNTGPIKPKDSDHMADITDVSVSVISPPNYLAITDTDHRTHDKRSHDRIQTDNSKGVETDCFSTDSGCLTISSNNSPSEPVTPCWTDDLQVTYL